MTAKWNVFPAPANQNCRHKFLTSFVVTLYIIPYINKTEENLVNISKDWYQFIFVWKDGSNRKNVVFLHGNKIIGFESFYFQNGGKTAARFAYRLRKELRGQGLSRYKHCLSLFRLTSGLPIIVCNINLLSKKCANKKCAK